MSHTIRSSCPRDCYDGCGIVVTLREGRLPQVSGDPDHPVARGALCAKCGVAYNGVFQDAFARLQSPLRRNGPKGSGSFVAISWDEALDTIARRFNAIIEKDGAASILGLGYSGTLSMLGYAFPNRWLNYLGASVVDYGTICNVAGSVAWELLFGTARRGFDPRTAKDSACILLWGVNPSHSAPHMHKHWLKDSPAKVVVVDPVRTRTAEEADLHLQPRPGSDAALAYGLLHALRETGAFATAFIEQHTVGFDEIRADIDRCTPEWAESKTGVAAADIRKAAGLYAAGPALLWCGQGLQRQPQGGNVMRAVGLLPAVTGNVGKAGAGFFYLNDTAAFAGMDESYVEGSHLAKTQAKRVGALDLADRLLDSQEFQGFIVWNSNPLASGANQRRLQKACSREDLFTVSIDLFATDTSRYADIVLPAASFLEFNDITYSYFNLTVGAQSKVREPIGESLPNQEIFRRIAKAMKLDEPALYESDESMIATLLQQCSTGFDFAELQKRGYFAVGGEQPQIFFEDLQFPTPSGHIEIASSAAARQGLPRTPHPGVDEVPDDGMLRLLSPASNWRMNDTYANDPRLDRRAGPAELTLSAADAARFGIVDGAAVTLSNDVGELTLTASISDIVLPGTVLAYKGRWPSREANAGNLNSLYDGRPCDMGESTAIHGVRVRISAA